MRLRIQALLSIMAVSCCLCMSVPPTSPKSVHTLSHPDETIYNKKLKPPTSLMSVETVFPDHQLNQSTVKWKLQTSKHFPKATSRFLSVSQLTYKEKTPPTSMFFLQHMLERSTKAARERPRISLVWNSCPSNQRKVNKHISGSDMTQAAKRWRRL